MNNKWAKSCMAATLALTVALPGLSAQAAEGSALVPLRTVSEAIGAKISWNGAASTANVELNGSNIAFKIGAKSVTVGGQQVALDQLVQLINGRTMVSQKAIRAIFGWEAGDKAAAKGFMSALQAGDDAALQHAMTKGLQAAQPLPLLKAMWASTAGAGALKGIVQEKVTKTEGIEHVLLTYQFEKVLLDVRLRLIDGLVDDVHLENTNVLSGAYTKPAYDTGAYVERDFVVGKVEYALPGTLTLPKGDGPFPVVVLVQGSGASDRDESIGALKPFRDLAVGLAEQGIATLRYDKRTYELPFHSNAISDLTVQDETVDDVLAAVDMLSQTGGIDANRIVVLGHSLGGSLLPRIKEQDEKGKVAGMVSVAGQARKLGDVIIEQADYLLALHAISAEQAAALKAQAQMTLDPNLQDDGSGVKIINAPISYWLDFGQYKATDLAKTQTGPLLVMQGEKDYQVTMEDFALWKQELASRTDVTYKQYPNLVHSLVDIAGAKSLPSDAVTPANVPSAVITDIANWLKAEVK